MLLEMGWHGNPRVGVGSGAQRAEDTVSRMGSWGLEVPSRTLVEFLV